jgi:hypothetical protein
MQKIIQAIDQDSLLSPKFRGIKVIYSGVKKINKEFVVITVKRYHYIGDYSFEVYSPKYGRTFVSFLHHSEILKLEHHIKERIFPSILIQNSEAFSFLNDGKSEYS